MIRAWAKFRQTCCYPASSSPALAGNVLLKAAQIAATPAADKAARIIDLTDAIRFAPFNESWAQASREISSARAKLARLSSEAVAHV
jgi:hypothetical protein